MDLILVRILFVALVSAVCFFLKPFGVSGPIAAGCGAFASAAAIVFEFRVRALSLRRLIGAVAGSVLGIFGASLFCLVLRSALPAGATSASVQVFVLLLMTYVGLLVGASKGDLLNPAALGGVFSGEKVTRKNYKVLDTSVIIDGRIADVADTGFLDGIYVIPEFVLRELQVVADSTDGSKRQRGRRGLDMLQRMQSNCNLQIQIVPDDFPSIKEVDLKLLELAKKWDAKVVTNDFNLNKVAQLHRVEVLNVNDLANALKPVVLPGEKMNIVILKEGKEYNQGVGYLDDGTMVVVDHARKLIGRNVEITVTSVLQTASGKMIFGRMEENGRSADSPRTPVPIEMTH
ncbi:PIN/TRAM domain-containing protein [Acidicapsa dinghuensis]|uniref:PIN/TRAM domain-containing protein n=1 Tax=Acidicapsa dinghuensis TaxID=2218256 RepID=A0ABW1ELT9_9BACT|nr:TRAM domain-containing protein [Acidicapsa dinghuensis]